MVLRGVTKNDSNRKIGFDLMNQKESLNLKIIASVKNIKSSFVERCRQQLFIVDDTMADYEF